MTKLLVTGAAGQLGQLVIKHLLESQNVSPADIVAGSRNPEKLSELVAKGIETRKVDFDDPNLADALKGVGRMLLISTDVLDVPGKRLGQHKAAVEAAKAAGVNHILYTSMPKPDDSFVAFAPDHLGTEEAIKASGLSYTILRNAWYFENFFASLPHVLQSGAWYTATGEGKAAYVAREDCARAAAAALANRTAESRTYNITGPEKLSTSDVATTASAALGKPISVVQVSDEQLVQGMVSAGMPEPVAQVYATFDTSMRADKFDLLSDDVEKLAGRAPISIEAFFKANKAAFGA